jgi:hypothetical protein
MAKVPEDVDGFPKYSKEDSLAMAHQAVYESKETLTIREAQRIFGVAYTILRARCNDDTVTRRVANQKMQILTPGGDDVLRDWVNILISWRWPASIFHLRCMASEGCKTLLKWLLK